MSRPVGGPGSDWETGEAEEQQTGAVHSSASACWGQLTHADIKTDTSTVQSYREVRLLQKPARPLYTSHLSPRARSQVSWQHAAYEHALVHKDKRRDSQKKKTCEDTILLQTSRRGGRQTQAHASRKREPITHSVSHGPIELLSWPHVLTTCIDHICWPEVLLAWGSPTVLPHWNGLADSRPNSLVGAILHGCHPALSAADATSLVGTANVLWKVMILHCKPAPALKIKFNCSQ